MSSTRSRPIEVHRQHAEARIGTTIHGKFTIQALIGVGGMAAVYAATHRNGHRVALKILRPELALDADICRRFRLEALLANRVAHPAVVPVLDDDLAEDGAAYLVMPLLHGDTLRSRALLAGGRLELRETLIAMHTVLAALEAAHRVRVIHRDIKPDNLFVTREGSLRILDFGIAKVLDRAQSGADTSSGRCLGTPAFMAPEQATGRTGEIDERTDLWAVGATMFTLLSGKLVHEDESLERVIVRAATRPAPPMQSICSTIDSNVAALIDRALSFDKRDRWRSAEAMNDALEGVYQSVFDEPLPRPPNALPSTDTDDPPDWGDRNITRTLRLSGDSGRARDARFPRSSRSLRWAIVPFFIGLASLLGFLTRTLLQRASLQLPNTEEMSKKVSSVHPEAEALFNAGVQNWREASTPLSADLLARAAELDPTLAAAPMLMMIQDGWMGGAARQSFEAAWRQQGALREPAHELLLAFEPVMRGPPRIEETLARLEHLHAQVPDDPNVAYALARWSFNHNDVKKAIDVLKALSQKQPSFAPAWLLLADSSLVLGRLAEARNYLGDCLRVASGSTECLSELATLEANEGACEQSEILARRLINVDPKRSRSYRYLARALFGRDRPFPAVRTALEQGWHAEVTPERRLLAELKSRPNIEILQGHFDDALAAASRWGQHLASDSGEFQHAEQIRFVSNLLLEIGDRRGATAAADTFALERYGWTADEYFDFSILPMAVRYLAGTLTRDEFVRDRDQWLRAQEARPRLVSDNGLRWILAFAQPTRTREDAEEALRALPSYLPLPDAIVRDPDSDGPIGNVYLLAGDLATAKVYLTRAASSCRAMELPIHHTWALARLGTTLKGLGDRNGACAAFQEVIRRWGSEPRSSTAVRARKEASALGCQVPKFTHLSDQ